MFLLCFGGKTFYIECSRIFRFKIFHQLLADFKGWAKTWVLVSHTLNNTELWFYHLDTNSLFTTQGTNNNKKCDIWNLISIPTAAVWFSWWWRRRNLRRRCGEGEIGGNGQGEGRLSGDPAAANSLIKKSVETTCGLYYKSFEIVIYNRNDSTIIEPLLLN